MFLGVPQVYLLRAEIFRIVFGKTDFGPLGLEI